MATARAILDGMWLSLHAALQQYKVENCRQADDRFDADGKTVLYFWQAQEHACTAAALRNASAHTPSARRHRLPQHIDGKASAQTTRRSVWRRCSADLRRDGSQRLEAEAIRNWHKGSPSTPAHKPHRAWRASSGISQRRHRRPEDAPKRQTSANQVSALPEGCAEPRVERIEIDRRRGNDAWSRVKLFKGVDVARARYLTDGRGQASGQCMRGRLPHPRASGR